MRDKNTFERALEFGSGFDWITPTFSIIGRLRGKVEPFKVPYGWVPFVQAALRQADIKICNDMIIDDWYCFDIRTRDADRAAALLGLVRR